MIGEANFPPKTAIKSGESFKNLFKLSENLGSQDSRDQDPGGEKKKKSTGVRLLFEVCDKFTKRSGWEAKKFWANTTSKA